MLLSTDKILRKVSEVFLRREHVSPDSKVIKHLDIGSGTGSLIESLSMLEPRIESAACNFTDEFAKTKNFHVDVVDLNVDGLPYNNNEFDFVTCTEVIEHLENYRKCIREAYRVLRPGGVAIFTTPNVLSLKSRIRYFAIGFHALFGPLTVNRQGIEAHASTGAHITPVSFFYLGHCFAESGFDDIELTIDKIQTWALVWLIFLYPVIKVMGWYLAGRERRKKYINGSNSYLVRDINSIPMLLGRTIVVSCRKPDVST